MSIKRSLLLNDNWDISLDSDGKIATTAGAYCDAQNVANAIRLFTHDAFLEQGKGVPHFDIDLGIYPAMSKVRSIYRKTALAVENIKDVDTSGVVVDGREIGGSILITNEQSDTATIQA